MNLHLTLAMATATATFAATASHGLAPDGAVALQGPATGPHLMWAPSAAEGALVGSERALGQR